MKRINKVDVQLPEWYYLNFFKKRGYDLDKIAAQEDDSWISESEDEEYYVDYNPDEDKDWEEFAKACTELDLEEIKRLAARFHLDQVHFDFLKGDPTPVVLALRIDGNTSGLELLLSLGAVVNVKDAANIKHAIETRISHLAEFYYDFFKGYGYDIVEMSKRYTGTDLVVV